MDDGVRRVPCDNSSAMERLVETAAIHLAWAVEAVAALIVAVGGLQAVIAYLASWFGERRDGVPPSSIRLSLGRSLALALEFLLGADILRTAVAPTWNDIGQLAAIAILRTALNYALERELRESDDRKARAPLTG